MARPRAAAPSASDRAGAFPATATPARQPPGGKTRQRSDAARQAIMGAALALVDENGYRALTVEAVAARTGAGKTTIYRHWPSLAALVLDAYVQTSARHVPVPDLGSLRAALVRFMADSCRTLARTNAGKTMATLRAEAQSDAEFARRLREQWVAARRAALRSILERGEARGELRRNLDLEFVIDGLYGPMWYRLLNSHAPLDLAFAECLVEQLFAGIHAAAMPRVSQAQCS